LGNGKSKEIAILILASPLFQVYSFPKFFQFIPQSGIFF
jgi:hypothetical protein